MQATSIKIGRTYEVTAGRNKTKIRVTNFNARTGSWECETESGKTISIKDPKRFLIEVGTKKTAMQTVVEAVGNILPKGKKTKNESVTKISNAPKKERTTVREDGTMSGICAAYEVLRDSGEPMNIKAIMEKINERGLAKLNGKTPQATVSAAIQREVISKGSESRFEKVGKGLFKAK